MYDDILKVYATYYVSENDDFTFSKKIDLLNFIQHSEDRMIMDLFEKGEIEPPMVLDEFNFPLPGLPRGGATIDDFKKTLAAVRQARDILKQKLADADKAVKDAIQSKIDAANNKIDMIQHKLSGSPKPETAGEKIMSGAKELAHQAKEKASEAGEKVVKAAGKAAEFAQAHPGQAAAVAVGVAAAITAGVMAYRRFISKAGKACRKAEDKAACKREYHNKGVQAKIAAMAAGKEKCFKTGNPEKCKSKIDVKIAGLKSKMKG